MSKVRVIEVPAGKLGKDELRQRRKMFQELARQRRQEKKQGPIATINPPRRSRRPGKPTRLPRYDRMPGRGPNRGPVDPGFRMMPGGDRPVRFPRRPKRGA